MFSHYLNSFPLSISNVLQKKIRTINASQEKKHYDLITLYYQKFTSPGFLSKTEKLLCSENAYLVPFRVQYLLIELFFSKNFFTADTDKDWSFPSPKMVVIALLDKKLIFFFFVSLLRFWKFLKNFIRIIFHSGYCLSKKHKIAIQYKIYQK